jgi:hypothetical protein
VVSADDTRALELYRLALSLVEAKGARVSVGQTALQEYRDDVFIVRHHPALGWLEVWAVGKVLAVRCHNQSPRVTRYRPGPWETEIEAAGKARIRERKRGLAG